jgi:hypothetical protein
LILQRIAGFLRQNLLGAIALVVALTGVSYAVAASTHTKTLKVCQLKHSHALVVAGKGVTCAGAKVTIGKPGPPGATGTPGPKGDTGVKGDTGNTGPAGVTNAFYNTAGDATPVHLTKDPNLNQPGSVQTTVLSLPLTAGSYWVSGKFYAYKLQIGGSPFDLDCLVAVGSASPIDSTHGTVSPNPTDNRPFTFEGPLTLAAPATVDMKCDSGGDVDLYSLKLAAIQVQNLMQSQPTG